MQRVFDFTVSVDSYSLICCFGPALTSLELFARSGGHNSRPEHRLLTEALSENRGRLERLGVAQRLSWALAIHRRTGYFCALHGMPHTQVFETGKKIGGLVRTTAVSSLGRACACCCLRARSVHVFISCSRCCCTANRSRPPA